MPLDPDGIAKAEELAREIVDSTGGQIDLGHARSIAYAQFEVLRVRSISTAVVAQILADCDYGGRTTSSDRNHLALAPTVPPKDTHLAGATIKRALATVK